MTRSNLTGTLKAFDCEKVTVYVSIPLAIQRAICNCLLPQADSGTVCLQPRGPHSVCSRTALRQNLGLERLPAKVNKPQGTATLELWVLYQQLRLEAAASASVHNQSTYSAQSLDSHATSVRASESSAQCQSLLPQSKLTSSVASGQIPQSLHKQAVHSLLSTKPPQLQAQQTTDNAASSSQLDDHSTQPSQITARHGAHQVRTSSAITVLRSILQIC